MTVDARTLYAKVEIESWAQFRGHFANRHEWLFRGMRQSDWPLETSIQRATGKGRINLQHDGERAALSRFRRRAHHYVENPPQEGQDLEWAALLRHYGGPSRLLDVSRSPYVALYFALEQADDDQAFAVWAINGTMVHQGASCRLEEKGITTGKASISEFAKIAFQSHYRAFRAVVQGEPERMNERMAAQQGLFLVPFDLSCSFEQNLLGSFDVDSSVAFNWDQAPTLSDTHARIPILKMIFNPNPTFRREIAKELFAMNISAATLYPGLDGFARSLGVDIKQGNFRPI